MTTRRFPITILLATTLALACTPAGRGEPSRMPATADVPVGREPSASERLAKVREAYMTEHFARSQLNRNPLRL